MTVRVLREYLTGIITIEDNKPLTHEIYLRDRTNPVDYTDLHVLGCESNSMDDVMKHILGTIDTLRK